MRIIFTRIFGFNVEAQVVRMRKGVEDSLRSDRGSRLRGIDCDPGSGRRSRVTPRRWRGNVICRAHYGYPIRMQCYLQAQTTHPAITKAPFGEVGTEAHLGGSHLATTYDLEGLLCDAGSRQQAG